MTKNTLSLYELNSLVRETIDSYMTEEYWVEAEVAEAHESRGHCYIDLIQKEPQQNTPIARASARCWRQTWMIVREYFERVTGQTFHAGIKVLLRVYPQFHEAYGFSWIVTDIDPTYTLGDMARRRQEIIAKLKEAGILELNKELPLPLFTQRIAVISSATAAGYGDFSKQLTENPYNYQFYTKLFPATMQGEDVERSIIAALNAINDEYDKFDCVVIIRGGGATSDMSGFDTLALAENVANFPLPVITGIGHDRDECILDIVSHTRVKTPTAAAALLIDRLRSTDNKIDEARQRIVNYVTRKMETEKIRIERIAGQIPAMFSLVKSRREARLDMMMEKIISGAATLINERRHHLDILSLNILPLAERAVNDRRHHLEMLEQRLKALDPALMLKRGYSITLRNGKAVMDAKALKPGDEIETRLASGSVKSKITEI